MYRRQTHHRLRAVGKRLLEQFPALEVVTQAFFERHDFT
jgi:hypothetical protein